ncbi:MAG: ABC transporter ATP-binding protein [Spirochaetes bacterium]|nr:ABC transporter ATP-binding protein [Spirochaetota bacterium]
MQMKAADGRQVLHLQNVSKRFGGLYAVRDINLDVAHGERLGLIGPNGAGKTTLFNVITGDLRGTEGKISLFGQDVTKTAVRKRVARGLRRTYQKSSLFDSLTVGENLYLGVLGPQEGYLKRHYNIVLKAEKDGRRMDQAKEIATMVRLEKKFDWSSGLLSHGERRQLEIGLAMTLEPRLVMFDEPVSGLSPDERKMVVDMLESLPPDITLLLIEHDMHVALKVSQRVVVLHEGRIIREGTPAQISADAEVQRVYLGGTFNG